MGVSSARSSRLALRALARQAAEAHRYAPRPLFLPVRSTLISPSGLRTMRTSARFSFWALQPTHRRTGIFFCLCCCKAKPLFRKDRRGGSFVLAVIARFGADVNIIAG